MYHYWIFIPNCVKILFERGGQKMKKQRILILYTSIGGGHYKAALGIKNYLKEHYPEHRVMMIDALKFTNKVVDKLVISAYVNMARYSPNVWGDIYQFSQKQYSVANFSNGVQKLLSIKLLRLFEREKPDIVISTHPFITEMVAVIKKRDKFITNLNVIMTDYASHTFWEIKHQYVNRYFVANEEMKYHLIHDGIAENKIFVTGIPVGLEFLKEYDKAKTCKELELDPHKKIVLMFGGGEYGLSDVKHFFKGLMEVEEDIQVIAVAGKSKRIQNMFKNTSLKYDKRVIVLGYTDKVAEYMKASDFVISKPGGLTTTEVLTSNVPFIIINPIPGQEEENARFLLNNGAAARIYDPDKTTPFLNQLFQDQKRLASMKEMQKNIAKPHSTEEIVKIILEDK